MITDLQYFFLQPFFSVSFWIVSAVMSSGSFFFNHIHLANNKTDAETGTAQALFNGQRMEKQEPSSQINFSTQFGPRHQIYRIIGKDPDAGKD